MKSYKINIGIIAIGSILAYLMIWNASRIVSPLHLPSHSLMKSFVKDLLVLIPVVGTLLVLHKSKSIITSLGLDSSILKGLAYSFVFTLPLCFGFAIFGKYNSEITLSAIVRQCVLAALFEEIVFRGFMFGQLFRYSKVGFFWAAFFPAILFGLGHIYQGHDIISSLAAFGITFIGALYFSWIYVEWNFNLWMPICLHFFMNLSWQLFIIDGTEVASGGLISNILRTSSIALAIAMTLVHRKREKSKIFNYPIWTI